MRLTLFLPGSLVPSDFSADLLPSLDAPTLFDCLARSELAGDLAAAEPVRGAAHLDWLATALFQSKPPASTAPYAWAAASGSPAKGPIWHADPIHLALAGGHLIAQPLDAHRADEFEAQTLLAVANELAEPAGCRFLRSGHHWFLQAEQPWSIETVPLDVVTCDSVTPYLPRGRDQRKPRHPGRFVAGEEPCRVVVAVELRSEIPQVERDQMRRQLTRSLFNGFGIIGQ
jgi:hypothetical protein